MDQELIKFIKEAKKRGFDDYEIKEPLTKKGWSVNEVEEAFDSLNKIKKEKIMIGKKQRITIEIDKEIIKKLEKRAGKNMFTLEEQIVDVLRRSTIGTKRSGFENEKLDDMLVALFSRKRRK